MRDYWAEYRQNSTTTHPYNENDDTILLWYNEAGYEHFLASQFPDGPLICNHSCYGPGDGSIYFIGSASDKGRMRRLGLSRMSHMSDEVWKECTLIRYGLQKPDCR